MRHLSACGDGICICWKFSLEKRLTYLGFPENNFDLQIVPQPVNWSIFECGTVIKQSSIPKIKTIFLPYIFYDSEYLKKLI